MSIQPPYDLLAALRHMREKIDRGPVPRTPSLQQLYVLLVRRIAEAESAESPTHAGTRHA